MVERFFYTEAVMGSNPILLKRSKLRGKSYCFIIIQVMLGKNIFLQICRYKDKTFDISFLIDEKYSAKKLVF
jgi:hypothetical protein